MDITKDIKTLKKQVECVLEAEAEARNSDKVLTIMVWRRFYSHFIKRDINNSETIPINNIMALPSQDGIKRTRAHIQNTEKRLLPTDIDVALERGWREDDWRIALGYHVEDPGQMKFAGL